MANPAITQVDLQAFHSKHFSTSAVTDFALHFLGPSEVVGYYEEDDDDGLGYYEDGSKRTLTDEQIAMFRHSEIQNLLKERRHAAEDQTQQTGDLVTPETEDTETGEYCDGETYSGVPSDETPPNGTQHRQASSKKGRKKKSFFREHIKPDLRKRTWDKVEAGLDSLDYGEEEEAGPAKRSMITQRRQISYDD